MRLGLIGGIRKDMDKQRNFMIRELAREPQEQKSSLQEFAKRMLVGFFVLMLLLTLLSRAADSVTIAKVNIGAVKGGILSFNISGSGIIQASSEKYLKLYEGVRIKEIVVEIGQQIEKGEHLFTYDLQELKSVRESLQKEYTIASLNLEKGRLNQEAAAATSEVQAAQIALMRAELDLSLAELELEAAKHNLEKEKKDQLEKAQKAVNDAEEYVEELKEGKEEAIKAAQREIAKSEQGLQELLSEKNKVEELLAAYKTVAKGSATKLSDMVAMPVNSDSAVVPGDLFFEPDEYNNSLTGISQSFQKILNEVLTAKEEKVEADDTDPLFLAQKNIFLQYYGEENYNNHVEEVRLAQRALARAKEDYMLTFIGSAETGGYLTTNQKAACIRAYEDANAALQRLTKKDRELSNAVLAYGIAIQSNSEPEIASTYDTLFSLLYQEDENKQKAISDASEQIILSQENLLQITKEWDRKLLKANSALEEAEETCSEAQEICDQMNNDSYDYLIDLKAQENQVRIAERNLEDAKAELDRAKERDKANYTANRTREQSNSIDLQIQELELQKKKNAVEEIDKIIARKGKVYSPLSGSLLHSDLYVGGRVNGTERVSISTDNYSFKATVSKEEAKHLDVGDEISIMLKNARENIETTIESIGTEDSQGGFELTAILPEGEYSIGAGAEFTISKKSKQYQQTIPLQAIRMDSNQVNYVLVIQETNTSLGNEMIAYRRNVTVIDKDDWTAAIEAAISNKENIILTSSKSIEEGDRVRINEDIKY
jgi:multidrug efflux pump subunit AcrA (membrane-fusion protein)